MRCRDGSSPGLRGVVRVDDKDLGTRLEVVSGVVGQFGQRTNGGSHQANYGDTDDDVGGDGRWRVICGVVVKG